MADYATVLAKLAPEEIRAGLEACVGRVYPPHPSEFFALAKAAKPAAVAPAHQPYKALPKPPRDPAKTAERFADLRAALRRDEYLPAA